MRCPSCHVALWSKYAGAGAIRPALCASVRSMSLIDRKQYWPQASLERRIQLLERG